MCHLVECRHPNTTVTTYRKYPDGRIGAKVECDDCGSWISGNATIGPEWFTNAIHKHEMMLVLEI